MFHWFLAGINYENLDKILQPQAKLAFSSSCKHTRRVEREHRRVERIGGEGGEQDEEDEEAGLVAAPAGGAARQVAQQGLLQKNVGKLA